MRVSFVSPYFAYGSNLNKRDMSARCPNAKPLSRAVLADWRLTFRGVADIEPGREAVVHGALWLLTDEDVRSLDRYEGAPSLYRQRLVEVMTEGGREAAMTYAMTSPDYLGLPSEWYLERIKLGYRDWGLPAGLLKEAVERTARELTSLGVSRYVPDGRKRLRAISDE